MLRDASSHEPCSRLGHDFGPRAGDPTRGGRAIDPVECGKLVDREPVNVILAQQHPWALVETREGRCERGADVADIARAQELELWIVDRSRQLVELVGRCAGIAVQLASEAPPRAYANATQPAAQPSPAGVA